MNLDKAIEEYAQKVVEDMDIEDMMDAVIVNIINRMEYMPESEVVEEIENSAYGDVLDK